MKGNSGARCALALILVACSAAAAQAGDDKSEEGECASRCSTWRSFVYGAGYGNRLGAYGSAGVVLGDVRYVGPVVASGDGILLQSQVGVNGWTVSAAWVVPWTKLPLALNYRGDRKSFSFPVAGLSMRAMLLRTWRDSDALPRALTYLGPEVEVAAFVHLRVGWLFRIAGNDGPTRTWSVAVGVGL